MTKVFDQLTNKTVLITGASSGLGKEIAYEASKKGARVILCARREERLSSILQECEKLSGRKGDFYTLDVSDYQSVDKVLNEIELKYHQIDVLVNCAGYGFFEPFLETNANEYEKMFSVNVLGLIFVTQKIALNMAKKGHGHIINIASIAGKIATPKSSIYSATKFAVIGFSNSLRLEMKPLGISVTTVNPGPIKTEFFDVADPKGNYLKQVGNLVLEPNKLAKEIVHAMGTYKREINRPRIMSFGSICYQLFPHIGDYFASQFFDKK